jgi:hypothetical protein
MGSESCRGGRAAEEAVHADARNYDRIDVAEVEHDG